MEETALLAFAFFFLRMLVPGWLSEVAQDYSRQPMRTRLCSSRMTVPSDCLATYNNSFAEGQVWHTSRRLPGKQESTSSTSQLSCSCRSVARSWLPFESAFLQPLQSSRQQEAAADDSACNRRYTGQDGREECAVCGAGKCKATLGSAACGPCPLNTSSTASCTESQQGVRPSIQTPRLSSVGARVRPDCKLGEIVIARPVAHPPRNYYSHMIQV